MNIQLSHGHRHTFDAIMRHPSAHNIQWHDVKSMLGELARHTDEPNGATAYTLNGRRLVLPATSDKDVGSHEQLNELRAFLAPENGGLAPVVVSGVNLLVVLDHRQADIFEPMVDGGIRRHIATPDQDQRHLHSVTNDANGTRLPEDATFYAAIVDALAGADRVLFFGSSTGAASAMEHLINDLKRHHPALSARVIGAVRLSTQHLTQDQMLAQARALFLEHHADHEALLKSKHPALRS